MRSRLQKLEIYILVSSYTNILLLANLVANPRILNQIDATRGTTYHDRRIQT